MPHLRIVVVDAPLTFPEQGLTDLRLIVQGRKGNVDGIRRDNDIVFEIDVDQKDGIPRGPFVQREGDGRRFLYLQWWGNQSGTWVTFRRIKLYFQQMPGWPHDDPIAVTVVGRDKKGGPACARAAVAEL